MATFVVALISTAPALAMQPCQVQVVAYAAAQAFFNAAIAAYSQDVANQASASQIAHDAAVVAVAQTGLEAASLSLKNCRG